jgi:hypothetical protein
MSKLDATERKAIPLKDFAGPDRSYPIENRSHAIDAKARSKQQFDAGNISESEYDEICAKADKKLGHRTYAGAAERDMSNMADHKHPTSRVALHRAHASMSAK